MIALYLICVEYLHESLKTEIEGESDVSGGIVRDTEKTERTRGGRSMKKIGQDFFSL